MVMILETLLTEGTGRVTYLIQVSLPVDREYPAKKRGHVELVSDDFVKLHRTPIA